MILGASGSDCAERRRRQHGHRQRYVTVDQQKYRCDDLKREDHHQVMRGVQGTHELSRDAPRRGQGNDLALSRETVMKLANSLPTQEPLRQTFLSAPMIREILGDDETPKSHAIEA